MKAMEFQNYVISEVTVFDLIELLEEKFDPATRITFNGNTSLHISQNIDGIDMIPVVQDKKSAKIDYENDIAWTRLEDKKDISLTELIAYLRDINCRSETASLATVNGSRRIRFYASNDTVNITT